MIESQLGQIEVTNFSEVHPPQAIAYQDDKGISLLIIEKLRNFNWTIGLNFFDKLRNLGFLSLSKSSSHIRFLLKIILVIMSQKRQECDQ
ncbi:hypothetical protein BpHYR1_000691 [Brachionus plicatilis]|uniref:Uncharacterized protein n=1 Tax=Brachionus plicatilis TaxID=10195 RepID=A0A3M7T6C9_BRAPC|nr:hypothetical protein BpHYR1_000691 [Brachionus plicatilis]